MFFLTRNLTPLIITHLSFFIFRHGQERHRDGKVRPILLILGLHELPIIILSFFDDLAKPGMKNFLASVARGRPVTSPILNSGPGCSEQPVNAKASLKVNRNKIQNSC